MAKLGKSDNSNSEPNKGGRIKRAGRGIASYGITRIRSRYSWNQSGSGLKAGVDQVREIFTPVPLDRDEVKSGYNGRYADGGRAAFQRQMDMANVDDDTLAQIAKTYSRNTVMFSAFALFFFVVGLMYIAVGGTPLSVLSGFSIVVVSLVIGSLALRQSFSGWQVRNRRFGGFREYMRS